MRALEALLIAGIVVVGPLARLSESSPQDKDDTATKSANANATRDKATDKQAQKAAKAAKAKKVAERKKRLVENIVPEHEPSSTPLPKRPVRSVTPPTLTSAELDRLDQQVSRQEQPQGRAGDADDRCRICPPDLLRYRRAATHARCRFSRS